jgi:hypothetical protein
MLADQAQLLWASSLALSIKKFSPEKIGTHERHTKNSAMLCWLFWIAARLM